MRTKSEFEFIDIRNLLQEMENELQLFDSNEPVNKTKNGIQIFDNNNIIYKLQVLFSTCIISHNHSHLFVYIFDVNKDTSRLSKVECFYTTISTWCYLSKYNMFGKSAPDSHLIFLPYFYKIQIIINVITCNIITL